MTHTLNMMYVEWVSFFRLEDLKKTTNAAGEVDVTLALGDAAQRASEAEAARAAAAATAGSLSEDAAEARALLFHT